MNWLAVSLAALLAGPLLETVTVGRRVLLKFLDGFVLVAVAGAVLLEVLPETYQHGGWPVLLAAPLGFFGPGLVEKTLAHGARDREIHLAALALIIVGLSLHAMTDGAALTLDDQALSAAVALHRIPQALLTWWIVRPQLGWKAAAALLVADAVSTLVGYSVGQAVLPLTATPAVAWFEAFVAGALLHVAQHDASAHHHDHGHSHDPVHDHAHGADDPATTDSVTASALGGLAAIAVLVSMFWGRSSHVTHMGSPHAVVDLNAAAGTFFTLALESAPALIFAYACAGLIHEFLPAGTVPWLQRGTAPVQALKGVLFGMPLPVCSCGVVPLYRSLVKRGAPPAAALAFLVATPEIGIDSILLSWPLLGGGMAVARIAAAFVLALVVGWGVGLFITARHTPPASPSGSTATSLDAVGLHPPRRSPLVRLRTALNDGFVDSVDKTLPWIVVGLLIAAFAMPLLTGGLWQKLPQWLEIPALALLGMPVYVCASGATPLVAVLMLGGVSPGAALAFLITGPATNATTFGLLAQMHGKKVALLFSVVMAVGAIGLGYLVNAFLPGYRPPMLDPHMEHGPAFIEWAALVALGLLFVASFLRLGPRGFIAALAPHDHDDKDDHGHAPDQVGGHGHAHGPVVDHHHGHTHDHDHSHGHSHDHAHGHGHKH